MTSMFDTRFVWQIPYTLKLGLYSLREWTSYHKILLISEATRFDVKMIASFRNRHMSGTTESPFNFPTKRKTATHKFRGFWVCNMCCQVRTYRLMNGYHASKNKVLTKDLTASFVPHNGPTYVFDYSTF